MTRSLMPTDARLASLEERIRAQDATIRQLVQRLARTGDARNPRLARTTSLGTYPTRSDARNCWEICFVDATYEAEAGVQAVEVNDRKLTSPYAVAHNIHNDPFIPDETLISVWWDNTRWWFDYEDEIQRGTLQGELVAGGSVSVKVQVGGVDTPGGAVTATDKLGVMTGVSGEKCYIKWQREHAEYWIIQKECDNSASVSTPTAIFAPPFMQPRREEFRARRAGVR